MCKNHCARMFLDLSIYFIISSRLGFLPKHLENFGLINLLKCASLCGRPNTHELGVFFFEASDCKNETHWESKNGSVQWCEGHYAIVHSLGAFLDP